MDAIKHLVEIIKQHPEDVGRRVRLIKLLTNEGQEQGAIHHYHLAIAQPKITNQERLELGMIAKSLGLFNEAEIQLKTAVQFAPADIRCLTALAGIYMYRGKFDMVIPLIEQIATIDPENRFARTCENKIIEMLRLCEFDHQSMSNVSLIEPSFHFPDIAFEFLLDQVLQKYPKKYKPVQRRIAFVIFHLRIGGIGKKVVNLVKHLHTRQDEVERVMLFCKSLNLREHDAFLLPLLKESDVSVKEYSPANAPPSPFAHPEIAEYAKVLCHIYQFGEEIAQLTLALINYRPEVVHGFGYQAAEFGIAAALAGVPKIVLHSGNLRPSTMSNDDNWLDHLRWVKRAYQALAKLPNVTITNNCENAAQDYAQWLELPPEKIQVLYNGVDTSSLSLTKQSKPDSLQQSLGIPDNCQVVGSAFRFTRQKNPWLWLDTAEIIAATNPNIHFVILGDGPLLEPFTKKIKSRRLSDRFHLPDTVIDMRAWYELMDVVLLTSSMEGTSNVAIEAQCCGVPVVSTNVGGMGETFLHGKSGWLVHPPEPEMLAERVLWILEHKEWRTEAAEAGSLFVQNRFNMENMINRILKLGRVTS
jgi:glycosyltransferase involved in cell wall biosynthesis